MRKALLILLLIFFAGSAYSQVRFYAQFRSIPFREASTNNFNVLTGVKLDPNKELIVGIGLTGSLKPSQLQGDLSFNKNNLSLGLNYYINRRLYLNGELNLNLIRNVVTDIVDTNIIDASENLLSTFFFDYDINLTYILFQRLHFSFGTGVADFARLAQNTTSDILQGNFQFNVALSLKLYVFQIKF